MTHFTAVRLGRSKEAAPRNGTGLQGMIWVILGAGGSMGKAEYLVWEVRGGDLWQMSKLIIISSKPSWGFTMCQVGLKCFVHPPVFLIFQQSSKAATAISSALQVWKLRAQTA